MGFKTGAGLIFGNSGGVSEAVLRFAAEKISGKPLKRIEFPAVRGEDGLRLATIEVNGTELQLGVVHGLANARKLAEKVLRGEIKLDLIEVMACPGGCVGGAGQPIAINGQARRQRTQGLYDADRQMDLHKSQENHYVEGFYRKHLGEVGGHKAHELLHTHYQSRRRIADEQIDFQAPCGAGKTVVSVCLGTNCYLHGSQKILQSLVDHVDKYTLHSQVEVKASFCFENCAGGPTVQINGRAYSNSTMESTLAAIKDGVKI
jgi:NADH-quinone oxidoreductase subunit G